MASGDGVFCKDKLDAGSRLLLETIFQDKEFRCVQQVCDLGCGWGAIGCFVAAYAPSSRVLMCDINARATKLANFNALHNNLQNARSLCADGLSAARAEYFDVVICNPPIRAGNATITRMFEGAHRSLKAAGVLVVVIRTAQGAKSWQKKLESSFTDCQTVAVESGYRVFKCTK